MNVEAAVAWIKELNGAIWVERRRPPWSEDRRLPERYMEFVRSVTPDEFDQVLRHIEVFDLPTSMGNSEWGFNLAMKVWTPEPPAIYPGVELKPELLLFLPAKALSLSLAKDKKHMTFDDAWRLFSPYTHSEKNRELLRRCNLPSPPTREELTY